MNEPFTIKTIGRELRKLKEGMKCVENKPLKEIFEEKGKPIFEKMGQQIAEEVNNEALRIIYDQMHSQGVSSWFCDGQEERETILRAGEPWGEKSVLEIGCGEGELTFCISGKSRAAHGIDYSEVAIKKAYERFGTTEAHFEKKGYREVTYTYDRIVMQGVLEHLDDPFTELKWMIDNLLVSGGDVITSSPCFLNPRGIVWMTLDMLGAVMSKTDLHYLDHHDFYRFCAKYNYRCIAQRCDIDWGEGKDMIKDLTQRIPLALKDGEIPYEQAKLEKFLKWLSDWDFSGYGATTVYKIQT